MKKIILSLLIFQSFSAHAILINLSELIEPRATSTLADSLKKFIQTSNKPVILKFFANWCQPCTRMHSIIEGVEEYFKDRIMIINIDIDKYKAVCDQYNFSKIPTLIFYKNGKEQQRVNSTSKETIIKIINELF